MKNERYLMKSGEKVSVIIPIYNVAEYLVKCISSVIGQTYSNLQVILVDDGSTDGSERICDHYAEEDSRIIVIHKRNEGLVRARKSGLAIATGEYICYVDGDDWIEADVIECLFKDMTEHDVDLVVSGYQCETKAYTQKVSCRLKTGIYKKETVISTMLYAGQFYEFGISQFIWAKLFRRAILWDVQMAVDDAIDCGEDVAVTYLYILKIRKLYVSDLMGYHYIQRIGSIMNCCGIDELDHYINLIKYLRWTFSQSIYSECLDKQLNQYTKNLLLTRCISYFDAMSNKEILAPYGGIPLKARIIIYGAGKMGQILYRYLKEEKKMSVIDWVDEKYMMYRGMNLEVNNPSCLKRYGEDVFDFIILAINNQNAIESIYEYLESLSLQRAKVRWLSTDFIQEDNYILERFK